VCVGACRVKQFRGQPGDPARHDLVGSRRPHLEVLSPVSRPSSPAGAAPAARTPESRHAAPVRCSTGLATPRFLEMQNIGDSIPEEGSFAKAGLHSEADYGVTGLEMGIKDDFRDR